MQRQVGKTVYIITYIEEIGIVQGVIDCLYEDNSIAVCNTTQIIGRFVEENDYFYSLAKAKKEAIKRIRETSNAKINAIKLQFK